MRNSDFVEITVKKENEILMKGAFIYGFRNIQNLVMKMKVCLIENELMNRERNVYMML